MRNRLLCCLLVFSLAAGLAAADQAYRPALPGYRYSFPRDHFNHPEFQTEWWYYTGNLKDPQGRAFGFQLTFFRQAVRRRPATASSSWDVADLYMAHAALSDLSGGNFYHAQRLNRAGPGIAGVDARAGRIWNGNWQAVWSGQSQKLDVFSNGWELRLTLKPTKPPVINGQNGVSRKGPAPGQASHYISLTRLETSGQIQLGGNSYAVQGASWMDHEFFTNQLAAGQTGWNWLSIQFSDNTELMLFQMRRQDGLPDPYSAGTYVDSRGNSWHLSAADFQMAPSGQTWTSPLTHAAYPLQWSATIPSLHLQLRISARLRDQEMTGKGPRAINYWEGAVAIEGTRGRIPVSGLGYLELTGYDQPVHFAP